MPNVEYEHDEDSLEITQPIDFDLSSATNEPISKGWHTFIIKKITFKLSSKKLTPQMVVQAEVAPSDGDEPEPDEGRNTWWNLQLEGRGAPITRRFMDAMGMDPHITASSGEEFNEQFAGTAIDGLISWRKYEGDVQDNCTKWREATFGGENILE